MQSKKRGKIFQCDEYIIKSHEFKFHCTLSHLLNLYPQQTLHQMQEKKKREICRIKRAVISQLISIEIL